MDSSNNMARIIFPECKPDQLNLLLKAQQQTVIVFWMQIKNSVGPPARPSEEGPGLRVNLGTLCCRHTCQHTSWTGGPHTFSLAAVSPSPPTMWNSRSTSGSYPRHPCCGGTSAGLANIPHFGESGSAARLLSSHACPLLETRERLSPRRARGWISTSPRGKLPHLHDSSAIGL